MGTVTFAYLWVDGDDDAWEKKFLKAFKDSDHTPVRVDGYGDDIKTGRMDTINSITTDYFVMCDPDDLIEPLHYNKAIGYLDEHPECSAVAFTIANALSDGRVYGYTNKGSFDLETLKRDPKALYLGVMYRTVSAQETINALWDMEFEYYEWAFALVIAKNYEVKKFSDVAYTHRHHSRIPPTIPEPRENLIMYEETVIELEFKGLL